MGSKKVIISSILRIPNKDYSVVKTLGPDPSSSTVDLFVEDQRDCPSVRILGRITKQSAKFLGEL